MSARLSSPSTSSLPVTQSSQAAIMPARKITSFADCPAEIVLQIAAYLPEKNISRLGRSNSLLYKWLNPFLYKTNIKSGGSTALFWAAAKGRESTVKLMITFGVDLHDAENPSSRRYLKTDYETEPEDGTSGTGTALHVAIKYGHLNVVALLERKGLDLEQTTVDRDLDNGPFQYTPLELAIRYRRPSCAMFLISHGADIDRVSKHGWTPLIYNLQLPIIDFRKNDYEAEILMFQILLESGADANKGVGLGLGVDTPLSTVFDWAADGNISDRVPIMVQMLLDKGADINTIIWEGCSILHVASLLGYTDLASYLLSRGANIEALDNGGRTPLHYALCLSSLPIMVWGLSILDRTDDSHDPGGYFQDKWHGNVETVKLLLEHGADPDAASNTGRTAHLFAAENPNRSLRAAFEGGLVNKKVDEERGGREQSSEVSEGHSSSEGRGGEGANTNSSLFN